VCSVAFSFIFPFVSNNLIKYLQIIGLLDTRSSATTEGPHEHTVSVEILSPTAKLYEKAI